MIFPCILNKILDIYYRYIYIKYKTKNIEFISISNILTLQNHSYQISKLDLLIHNISIINC